MKKKKSHHDLVPFISCEVVRRCAINFSMTKFGIARWLDSSHPTGRYFLSSAHLPHFHMLIRQTKKKKKEEKKAAPNKSPHPTPHLPPSPNPSIVISVYHSSIIKVYETGCVSASVFDEMVSVSIMRMHGHAFH